MRRIDTAVLRDRPVRRAAQLAAGLVLYGASIGLLVRSGLGLDPWTVFSQGVARTLGVSIGAIVVASSLAVMLLWIPLRQRPGLGTVANAAVVGPVIDLTLAVLPPLDGLPLRALGAVSAIVATGLATAVYVGAGWGPGPRDGLMLGLRDLGLPLALARGLIEASVCLVGWLLGGTVGLATLAFALGIGPLVALLLPRFTVGPPPAP